MTFEFESIFKNILGYESGSQLGSIDEKKKNDGMAYNQTDAPNALKRLEFEIAGAYAELAKIPPLKFSVEPVEQVPL